MSDNNAIAGGKVFYALMKLIHVIEVDSNNVRMAPWKSKRPNLDVLKYIRGGKYPEAKVGKVVYSVR